MTDIDARTDIDAGGFRLPDLGEGLAEAEIVIWHVGVGDHVVADQPLVTVETDKAVVDIPAPRAGRIEALHAQVGDRLDVGELLVTFYTDEAEVAVDRGAVVGELAEAPVRPAGGRLDESTVPRGSPGISPKARRRARELRVNLDSVTGTGPGGVIQLEDVETAASGLGAEPLRGVRRAMAQRMADAHARVARATVTGEADISSWQEGERPMPRLVRAIGKACLAQPRLNSRFDDRAMTLTEESSVNLGIAMDTRDGLFVPVLREVTDTSPEQIETELARLEAAVADRSITLAEMRGQTITLSNFGAIGGIHAEMVVVPPQVAIVGAGRVFDRPGGSPGGSRLILPLSLSFDHRVVTGAEACEFLVALSADLDLAS